MAKLHFAKWFHGDWIRDTRTLELEERGAWMDLIAWIWIRGESGKISISIEKLARLWSVEVDRAAAILLTLKRDQICEILTEPNGDITVISRRIERDVKDLESNRIRQRRHYGKVKNSKPNANLTPEKPEARSQKPEKNPHSPLNPASAGAGSNKSQMAENGPNLSQGSLGVSGHREGVKTGREDTRRSKSGGSSGDTEPDPGWSNLIEHIDRRWLERKPVAMNWEGKHFKMLKGLVRHYQAAGVMAMFDLYWDDKDDWIRSKGHDLMLLPTRVAKILDNPSWKVRRGKYESEIYSDAGESPIKDALNKITGNMDLKKKT